MFSIEAEPERHPLLKCGPFVLKANKAQLWPPQVRQDADRSPNDAFALPVAHVQAEDISARRLQIPHHLVAAGGRPKCRDNFDISISEHSILDLWRTIPRDLLSYR
jgi:hypothetical protein